MLLQTMKTLSVTSKCQCHQERLSSPTWGRMNALLSKAWSVVSHAGKKFTLEHLFLAMCTLIICPPAVEAEVIYWAHVPNPPLLRPYTWKEPIVVVTTFPMNVLSPPYGTGQPDYPNEEGTFFNYTQFVSPDIMCFGIPPCYPIRQQNWIVPGGTWDRSRTHMVHLSAQSVGPDWTEYKDIDAPVLLECEGFSYNRIKYYKPLVWQNCRGMKGKIYRSQNHT
ncbi:endogenous retrovirus group K member 19 Env polyprotein-like [Nannospalax galili]|uniref:endogenous retrovirus group K member 19 Env polyprotein-like n=1 Tax=Nannospalax galili TaxID=1026970 RepID=UPI00111C215A|nr:endogenous retrovirus group K member 19 Env polyprotein-like [Nannospalax galili]